MRYTYTYTIIFFPFQQQPVFIFRIQSAELENVPIVLVFEPQMIANVGLAVANHVIYAHDLELEPRKVLRSWRARGPSSNLYQSRLPTS